MTEPANRDDHDGGVARRVVNEPRLVDKWLELIPRLEQAKLRAAQVAPALVGLSLAEAQAVVDADGELTLEVETPGPGRRLAPPIGTFGLVRAVVEEGIVVSAT